MKRAILLLALLGPASGPAHAAIDGFYSNRMKSGVQAFEQGDWEAAARQLRIACFGHLDEPVPLAEGLIRLAVAEARRGNEEAFRRIFPRLVELEERFSAYGSAALPPALRQQFEALAAQLVPAQRLRSTSSFAAVAARAEIESLSGLPPDRRRAELLTRIESDPDRPDWSLEMARLELADRHPQAALGWLDRLPATIAELPPATCLRQQAASEAGSCDLLGPPQPFCPGVPPKVAEFRLECLVDAGGWAEAAGLIGGLEPEIRQRRRIARLERRVRANFEGDFEAATAAWAAPFATSSAATPAAEPAPQSQATAAEPALAAADPQEIARLRARLQAAATGDDLAALRDEAEAFADDHPASRQVRLLVAELAYLQSDWPAAVRHFSLAGRLRYDEADLTFYQAVALYQTGETAAAADLLRPVASRLESNSFVEAWVQRILAPGV